MSFSGTTQKCKACEKTVYLMDQLNADGVVFHKSCFKCTHCKKTLQLSNYSSLEGVLYCKPHSEQLFKETGSYNKNFQSPAKPVEKLTPELTRSPSKAASMFSGTQEKCATCGKTAYPLEKFCRCYQRSLVQVAKGLVVDTRDLSSKSSCFTFPAKFISKINEVTVEGQSYHKLCFKCSHGGCPISPSNYAALEGILYCKHHFSQLFKEKGSYNHLIKCASVKRAAATNPVADS